MNKIRQHITVYEHERIRLGQCFVGVSAGKNNGFTEPVVFDEAKLLAMQKHFGEKSVPYYQLIHKGIQFNEHVGVIQVGNLLIEVLPKADDIAHSTNHWRNMLIDMMRAVGSFDINVTSSSMLKLKSNTILDVYIEMFVSEVEYLLRSGLIKKYRKTEANARALKGSLMFGQNLQHSVAHTLGNGMMGNTVFTKMLSVTAAACDARMAGAMFPVMSNSGSGNQGIAATLPVSVFAEDSGKSEDELIRALTLSHLMTIYIKQSLGRLSGLCGAVVAATGSACGVTYLMGGSREQIGYAVKNMIGNITGMICDGAKPSCALKVSNGVSTATLSALLAMDNKVLSSVEGITDDDVDKTILNLTKIGREGMNETDRMILDIMTHK